MLDSWRDRMSAGLSAGALTRAEMPRAGTNGGIAVAAGSMTLAERSVGQGRCRYAPRGVPGSLVGEEVALPRLPRRAMLLHSRAAPTLGDCLHCPIPYRPGGATDTQSDRGNLWSTSCRDLHLVRRCDVGTRLGLSRGLRRRNRDRRRPCPIQDPRTRVILCSANQGSWPSSCQLLVM
jgi:hypothetical protein